MLAQVRCWLKSTWNLRFRHSSTIFFVFPSPFSPLSISLIVKTPNPLPKTTNLDVKQKNKTKNKTKPKRTLVLRSTNASRSSAEIDKPKLRELLRCQDRDFWVWVFALVPRYYESVGLGCCSTTKIWWIYGWGIRRKGRIGRMKEKMKKGKSSVKNSSSTWFHVGNCPHKCMKKSWTRRLKPRVLHWSRVLNTRDTSFLYSFET